MGNYISHGDLVEYIWDDGTKSGIHVSNLTIVDRHKQDDDDGVYVLIDKGPGWVRHDGSPLNPVRGKRCQVLNGAKITPVKSSDTWKWDYVEFYNVEEEIKMTEVLDVDDTVWLKPAKVAKVFGPYSNHPDGEVWYEVDWHIMNDMYMSVRLPASQIERYERTSEPKLKIGEKAIWVSHSEGVDDEEVIVNYIGMSEAVVQSANLREYFVELKNLKAVR